MSAFTEGSPSSLTPGVAPSAWSLASDLMVSSTLADVLRDVVARMPASWPFTRGGVWDALREEGGRAPAISRFVRTEYKGDLRRMGEVLGDIETNKLCAVQR